MEDRSALRQRRIVFSRGALRLHFRLLRVGEAAAHKGCRQTDRPRTAALALEKEAHAQAAPNLSLYTQQTSQLLAE
jgi:hypothetical protein